MPANPFTHLANGITESSSMISVLEQEMITKKLMKKAVFFINKIFEFCVYNETTKISNLPASNLFQQM